VNGLVGARISVVIPCFNGGRTLGRQIEAILGQASDRLAEIIVADNGSTDDSAQVVSRYATKDCRVSYVRAFERSGINHARNQGVRASSGDLILLCDADDIVSPGWLLAYDRAYRLGGSLLGGPLRYVSEAGEYLFERNELFSYFGPLPWPAGANCGFARAVYDRLGGFDESFRGGGDETEFFWRGQIEGGILTFVEEAWIDYVQRAALRATFRQRFNYGRSEVKLFRKFGPEWMKRPSWVRATVGLLSSVPLVPVAICSGSRSQALAQRMGRNAGRLAELWGRPNHARCANEGR
jgi:glycosyltransferase involved in cell wall biosynthesis